MRNALEILAKGTVIPAIPLVLDENRKFDEKGQRLLIRYYLAAGAGGVAVAVHTTQFEIRLPQFNLFNTVLDVAADEIGKFEEKTGKTIIKVAGVCGATEQAVAEATTIKEKGFDVAMLSPGGLADKSIEYMLERAESVAAVMPVLGFYLQPAVGGRYLSFDFWEKFCKIENIVGIKAAPFNRYQTIDLMRAVALSPRADKIAMYTGNDDNIVMDLLTPFRFEVDGKTYEKRFVGGLLGDWSMRTHSVVKLFEMIKAEAAKDSVSMDMLALANEVTDANAAFFDAANGYAGCIPGVHELLRRQGVLKNILTLNPDEVMSPGQADEITRVCKMYWHSNDDEFIKDFLKNEN